MLRGQGALQLPSGGFWELMINGSYTIEFDGASVLPIEQGRCSCFLLWCER